MRTLFYFKCSMHVLHLQQINKRTIMKYLFVALLLIATFVFPSSIYAHKKDISSYKQLMDLGIAPTEEQNIVPTTRADYPLNGLPEVRCNDRRLWVVTEVRRGSSPGVAEEIAIYVRFRKKGLFGKWYNYNSTTYLKFEPNGIELSKSGNSTHEYLWARIFQNGQRVPFQGLCSVKFQGFGAKCGSTKYFFRVDL